MTPEDRKPQTFACTPPSGPYWHRGMFSGPTAIIRKYLHQNCRFAAARSGINRHAPLFEQAVLYELIADGHFGRHLRRMQALYYYWAIVRGDAEGVGTVRRRESVTVPSIRGPARDRARTREPSADRA
jgi:hypothetical protein